MSFRPGLGGMTDRYYDTYIDERGNQRQYSYFEGQLYSPPSSPRRSGSVSLSLSNNLEAKVRPKSDTTQEMKKVMLLNNLGLSTNYNLFADSLNWSSIRVNGRTSLINNRLNLNFSGTLDPYAVNNRGNTINQSEFSKTGDLARLSSFRISMGTDFSNQQGSDNEQQQSSTEPGPSSAGEPGAQQQGSQTAQQQTTRKPTPEFQYFQFPWNLNLDYSLNYSKRFNVNKQEFESEIRQTIGINGNFSLTPKWEFSFNSNYDIQDDRIGPTQVTINRDLHCFSMSFTWVPIGYRRMYNFRISVNSSMLQDVLKFRKDRTFYDNF